MCKIQFKPLIIALFSRSFCVTTNYDLLNRSNGLINRNSLFLRVFNETIAVVHVYQMKPKNWLHEQCILSIFCSHRCHRRSRRLNSIKIHMHTRECFEMTREKKNKIKMKSTNSTLNAMGKLFHRRTIWSVMCAAVNRFNRHIFVTRNTATFMICNAVSVAFLPFVFTTVFVCFVCWLCWCQMFVRTNRRRRKYEMKQQITLKSAFPWLSTNFD